MLSRDVVLSTNRRAIDQETRRLLYREGHALIRWRISQDGHTKKPPKTLMLVI